MELPKIGPPKNLPKSPEDIVKRIPGLDLPTIPKVQPLPEFSATESKLVIGMLGWTVNAIEKGESEHCYFPIGEENPIYRGGRTWERAKVTAIDDIRANTDVFIVDDKRHVQEYSQLSMLKETTLLNSEENIRDDFVEETNSFRTAGFNKITGIIYADQDLTVYIDQSIDGKNWDETTEAKNYTAESNDCAFSVEIVAPYVRIRFVNNSGDDTTECRRFVQLSAGF